ncbi:cubilin [Phlebotomus argentipes]|uniref:cubilin n=1 Tax=Phlebotomus argentipes TaxID=94469 RepID=UPI0028937220|nr:cubilin [Phlebotomus argentipes]
MWNKSTVVLILMLGLCECWDKVQLSRVDFSPMYVGECGEIYVTDKVVIESPGFPKQYLPNIHCEYILWSPCPTNFHVQFHEFDLEASHLCHKDQLRVSRDGEDVHLCGRVAGVTSYRSQEGVIKLNFITDNAIEYMGFRLLITRDSCHSGSVNGTNNFATVTGPNTGWSDLRNHRESDGERAITIQYQNSGRNFPAFKLFVNTDWNQENQDINPAPPSKCSAAQGWKNWYTSVAPLSIGGAELVGNGSEPAHRQDEASSHLPQQFPQPFPPPQQFPQPFPPPVQFPPSCCRFSPLNRPRFLISSPNFPHRNVNNFDCVYVIERLVTSCRLRVIFRYFLLPDVDQNFCVNSFVEMDGRRFCGCRSGVVYLSQWGFENRKFIRLRNFQAPVPTSIVQGFIMEVIQEECPYRYLGSVSGANDTAPREKLDFRPADNATNSNESFPSRADEGRPESEDYEPSMKFFFPNTANRCYFGWLQWFQLTVNPLWITRPQCRV